MRITSKSSCIFQQGSNALIGTHLVEHGTLNITCNTYQSLIGFYHDDVIVLQTDVTCQASVKNVVVQIDDSNYFAIAIYLDVTECTKTTCTTCTIQSIEDIGEGTQMVGSWCANFTHDVNLNSTGVAYSYF